MKARVIVIGGDGIVGREFCSRLSLDYEVISADLSYRPGFDENPADGAAIRSLQIDILNKQQLLDTFQEDDVIINLAAKSRVSDCNQDIYGSLQVNLVGAVNVMLAAKEKRCGHLILASSLYAKGHTGGFYSASKRALEEYAISFMACTDVPLTVIRLGSIAGGIEDVNSLPTRLIRHSLGISQIETEINGDLIRDYLPLPSIAESVAAIILNESYFDSFVEFLTGIEIDTHQVISKVCMALGVDEIKNIEIVKRELDFSGQYVNSASQRYNAHEKKFYIKGDNSFESHLVKIISEVD